MTFYKITLSPTWNHPNSSSLNCLNINFQSHVDFRYLSSQFYKAEKVNNYSEPDEFTKYIPLEKFYSKIHILTDRYYNGVFSAIVTHPTYGIFIAGISIEKVIKNNMLNDGIVKGETLKEYEVSLARTGGQFTIKIY